jgi:hypothetical protein
MQGLLRSTRPGQALAAKRGSGCRRDRPTDPRWPPPRRCTLPKQLPP